MSLNGKQRIRSLNRAMLPGVTVYRWMLPRPSVFREDANTPASR